LFAQRVIQPELMDHAPPEVARRNLNDLIRINRNFGGHFVLKQMVSRVIQKDERFSLLDIGAASGDTARVLQAAYPGATITSLDYNAVNLHAAPRPKVLGDAFALPFPPESFDYVMCSLFLHHFTDEGIVGLLRSFYALARRGLLISDLERSIFPYYFLPITRLIYKWDWITVHDGMISVKAAFRKRELLGLAREAGIPNPEVRVHRPAFRIELIGRR
jgi:2-polyprenyl-3-methyl-5-hydroxy-6-metoxy-1,4-benzoquinol methylase